MNNLAKKLSAAVALGLLLGASVAIIPGAHAAQQQQAVVLNDDQQAAVDRINAYLNSFKTLKGEFTQTSPKGRTDRGLMFISKPGKLRFDYAPPSVLLIASDGKWLTIKDKKREKGDQYPLSATPFRYFVSNNINLGKDATIIGVEQQEGFTTVALADKKGGIRGQLLLVFDEARGELVKWVSIDGRGQRMTVDVSNLEKNVEIDPKLFQVTIKRKVKE